MTLLKIPHVELGIDELNNILCYDEKGRMCQQISKGKQSMKIRIAKFINKKVISILCIGIMVCSIYMFAVKNKMLIVNEESESIQEHPLTLFEGKRIVREYSNSAVKFHGVDQDPDEYKKVVKADKEEQRESLEKEKEKRLVHEDTSQIGGHETENTYYAIYPTTIIETDPADKPDRFFIWEKEISITFPQIYYSNEYEGYDRMLEISVNHELFLQSLGNDDSFLFRRDMRELRKFVTDYEITKADDELISIKYEETSWDIFHANSIYMGITIDVVTGEKVALPELITLEDDLAEQVENGEIELISLWHEWEDVKSSVEAFNDFYKQGAADYYSCYYLEEDAVDLLIPLMQGNAAYVILRIPF